MFGKHNKIDVDWLAGLSVFCDFSRDELEQVAKLGERLEVGPGTVLTDQGRFGDTAYVVIEGEANVFMNGEFVTEVKAKTLVGEMALIEHRPRNATVVASTDMVLLGFGIEEFKELLEANPSAREIVQSVLGRRVQENQERQPH